MVSQLMVPTAWNGVMTPNSTMATAPRKAAAGRSSLTHGRRVRATPAKVRTKIIRAAVEANSAGPRRAAAPSRYSSQ